jgi:Fe-S cluster biogenesis protein NfuA
MSTMGEASGCGLPGGAPEKATGDPDKIAQVEAVLEKIRPYLAADGGNIHLVAIEDDVVCVRLQGACMGCQAAAQTLYQGIEPQLRAECDWLKGLRAV